MNPIPASAECRLRSRTPAESYKRDGWRENGILVVDVADERLTWPERELVKQIGTKLYGPTKHDGTTTE